jgi:uncharacterized protein (TIGR00297 family)
MATITTLRFFTAMFIASVLAIHGIRKNLTISGAVAAFLVGLILFTLSPPFGIMLIGFYLVSSKLTAYQKSRKLQIEEFSMKRDAVQVLTNSVVLVASVIVQYLSDKYDHHLRLYCVFGVAVLACCTGDTWASELGSVLSSTPVLVTTLKSVPPGTNGAVSWAGLAASILGGAFIGTLYEFLAIFFPLDIFQFGGYNIIGIGALAGFVGSLVDSFLGATVQASYYCNEKNKIVKKIGKSTVLITGYPLLSNEMVNLVSSLATGLLFVHLLY